MNDLGVIHLTNGGFCVVDAARVSELSKYNWSMMKNGYIRRRSRKTGDVYLHRQINATPKGFDTDHKNRIKIDNTERNLRTAKRSQNCANKTSASALKGVRRVGSRWSVQIGKESVYVGRFDSSKTAALAYNKAAINRYGEFATLNPVT